MQASPLIDTCLCGVPRRACDFDAAHDARILALAERDALSEDYIPSAREARIAYSGRTAYRAIRERCTLCHDHDPLADASPIYGDKRPDAFDHDDRCESCGTRFADLSLRLQAAHDAQQRRWSRVAAPTVLIEYGIRSEIRCRVY